jgi:pyruvate,water dikinase
MLRFPKELGQVLEHYREEVETFQRSDPSQLSDVEIAGQIRKMVFGTSDRLLSIDFLMIVVIGVAYQILGTFLEKVVGENAEMIRARLISGVSGNVTMETNTRLWDLSQVASASASVSEMIKSNEPAALQTQLSTISEGREFLKALDAFLKEYGHREIRLDIMYPTWGEDPTPVFGFIRAYLDLDPDHSPYKNQARLDNEREHALQMIEEKLQNMGPMRYLLGPIFSRFLKLAQVNTRERDTIHFELTRLFPTCRKFLKILGERWVVKGWMEEVEDVYFLRFEEMEAQAAAPCDKKQLIKERRRKFEFDRNQIPPDIIRMDEELYLRQVHSENAQATKLSGIAGSPGKAQGKVKVISDPSEFDRLTEGDVLVAPLTTPVWTPLFAIASAVVTDTGGILSHGAIVAREFGIPAVLSVPGATQILQDGQFVLVDGETGIVTLG